MAGSVGTPPSHRNPHSPESVMEFLAAIAAVLAVWTLAGIVIAIVVGRASAAAEHEYQVSALGREVRSTETRSDTAWDSPSVTRR